MLAKVNGLSVAYERTGNGPALACSKCLAVRRRGPLGTGTENGAAATLKGICS